MTTPDLCHCGQPLHYTDKKIERYMKKLVAQKGQFIHIQVSGRSWNVQRHYLALHGIKGYELPSLGFEEII